MKLRSLEPHISEICSCLSKNCSFLPTPTF